MRKTSVAGVFGLSILAGCTPAYEELRAQDEIAYNAFDEVIANGQILSTSDAAFGATKMVVKHDGKLYTCFMHVISIDKSRCQVAK